jgi:hypothetical protein
MHRVVGETMVLRVIEHHPETDDGLKTRLTALRCAVLHSRSLAEAIGDRIRFISRVIMDGVGAGWPGII